MSFDFKNSQITAAILEHQKQMSQVVGPFLRANPHLWKLCTVPRKHLDFCRWKYAGGVFLCETAIQISAINLLFRAREQGQRFVTADELKSTLKPKMGNEQFSLKKIFRTTAGIAFFGSSIVRETRGQYSLSSSVHPIE